MSYLDEIFSKNRSKKLTPEEQQKESEKRLEAQRQKIISFKKFFGEDHGREVMLDLMNRFYILAPLPETNDPLALARAEGKREVVLYLLSRANTDVAKLDEIMKGNFS